MRLIDATKIEQFILNNCSDTEEINTIYGELINAPTIEERKEGHWIRDGHHIECSECSEYICDTDREGDTIPQNFCPNCGAYMGGE